VAILGWGIVVYGISASGQGGDQLGKPPWWLDSPPLTVIPFVLPLSAGIAAIRNWRCSTLLGVAAALATGVVAVIDRTDSPGVAAAEGVVALIGLVTTVAASAGRMPKAPIPPAVVAADSVVRA
jgi:hypothetical protein